MWARWLRPTLECANQSSTSGGSTLKQRPESATRSFHPPSPSDARAASLRCAGVSFLLAETEAEAPAPARRDAEAAEEAEEGRSLEDLPSRSAALRKRRSSP